MADNKPQKVFDVARPGKSAPSTSSKPILITNRPVLKDPMMVSENDPKPDDAPKPLHTTSHLKIEPVHHEDSSEKLNVKTTDEPKPEPTLAEEAATSTSESAQADPPPATEAATEPSELAKPESESEPEADAVAADDNQATDPTNQTKTRDGTKEAEADIIAQKELERAAELQKLADSHKYYLPINQVEKRRNRRAVWLGVFIIVLLGLAWADVALDAGLVTIPGVKAPTHFFSK